MQQQLLLIHNNSLFLSSGDHTRVKLTTKEGGDYINANLIKVWDRSRLTVIFSPHLRWDDKSLYPDLLPTSSAINQRGPDTDIASLKYLPFPSHKWLISNFNNFFQFPFFQMMKNRYYRVKLLPKRFHLNGHILGFHPQTQKLEQECTA